MTIRVQTEPFDPGAELNAFSDLNGKAGAVVSFTGVVRGEDLDALELEHYPGMTEKALEEIRENTHERWSLVDSMIIHRFGRMTLGEPIMMVAVASAHRAEAFEAASFLMDFLKSRAPFWKKEMVDGKGEWVDAREEDEAALEFWANAQDK